MFQGTGKPPSYGSGVALRPDQSKPGDPMQVQTAMSNNERLHFFKEPVGAKALENHVNFNSFAFWAGIFFQDHSSQPSRHCWSKVNHGGRSISVHPHYAYGAPRQMNPASPHRYLMMPQGSGPRCSTGNCDVQMRGISGMIVMKGRHSENFGNM